MRTPPLLADFIHPRDCKSKCKKFLTRPEDRKQDQIEDKVSTKEYKNPFKGQAR